MEWGAERANGWLIAYVTSWVQAVFVTDPIKVIDFGITYTQSQSLLFSICVLRAKSWKNISHKIMQTIPLTN